MPSTLYWSALTRWGIFRHPRSQGWYHARFASLADRRSGDGRADDPGVVWIREPNWHPRLPKPPTGFPWEASFALTCEEADFLRGRLEERCAGTLLAWLARNGSTVPAEHLWDDPDTQRAPVSVCDTVELAQRFSLHVEGMPLLYNLLVAERRHDALGEDGVDPVSWAHSERRIRCPRWQLQAGRDERGDNSRMSSRRGRVGARRGQDGRPGSPRARSGGVGDAPNQRWVADTTEFVIGSSGRLYLAAVLDLFPRFLVGWVVSAINDRHLVIKALQMALKRRRPPLGLLHHSDRGSPYASEDDQAILAAHGILGSMSRRGDCLDNAVMERWFSTVKLELGGRFESYGQAKMELFDSIEVFYNQRRRHSTLGQISPAEFERRRLTPAA